MSRDKRKKFERACAFLRDLNNSHYAPPQLNKRGPYSMRNPTLRYIVKRGLAKLVRINWSRSRNGRYDLTRTKIETGFPWSRRP
jgi:hypothetical protein